MNFQNKINLDYTELIWSKEESLSSDFCDNMIEKFEKDTNRYMDTGFTQNLEFSDEFGE